MATTKALSDLPLDKLVGEPMIAAAKAQLQMAQSNLQSLQAMNGQTETFNFEKSANSQTSTTTVTVPTMAVVEPANLAIEEVINNFTFEVSTLQEENDETEGCLKGSVSGSGLLSGLLGIEASGNLQSHSAERSSYNERGKLNIQVKATRTGHSKAMQTIIDAALDAVVVEKS